MSCVLTERSIFLVLEHITFYLQLIKECEQLQAVQIVFHASAVSLSTSSVLLAHKFGLRYRCGARAVVSDSVPVIFRLQCYNFLRLCELCVRKCPSLRQITLLTGSDPGDQEAQRGRLNQIGTSLSQRGVKLAITFSDTLHDREIRPVSKV